MSDAIPNPYDAPREVIGPSGPEGAVLGDLSAAEIKKLYNHSRSIGALTVIWLLGGGWWVLAGVSAISGNTGGRVDRYAVLASTIMVACLVLGGLMTTAAIGCWRRSAWGRTVGIALCCLGLVLFPIGTVIAIMGLISFIQGKRLFGPNRLTHAAIKEAYSASKWRKS